MKITPRFSNWDTTRAGDTRPGDRRAGDALTLLRPGRMVGAETLGESRCND